MRVSHVEVFPLKSGLGVPMDEVGVLPWGLVGDRRWMVVGAADELISARDLPALLHVRAAALPDGGVRLSSDGEADLVMHPPDGEPVALTMFHQPVTGLLAGAEADVWIRRVVDRDDLRLVWSHDPRLRRPEEEHSEPGDSVSFADGYPLLLTTTASLTRLNEWLVAEAAERGEPEPAPLPMNRFRPNVVVDGAEPFAEDDWRRVRIGEVVYRSPIGCPRCVMTTIDRDDLSRSKEPIRTMARHRAWDGATWFGMNLIPEVGESADPPLLRVGDDVEVLG